MRSLPPIFLVCLFICLPLAAHAQHPQHSPIPAGTITTQSLNPSGCLGNWGCLHKELHALGVISKIIERKGGTCCDGETSGECRATVLQINHEGKLSALLDGELCPLPVGFEVFQDINLPHGISAVVCASAKRGATCPAIYCAASKTGS